MPLNKQEITEEIKERIFKKIRKNDKENIRTQNKTVYVAKEILRRKIITIHSYFKRTRKVSMNNLTLQQNHLEKDKQNES